MKENIKNLSLDKVFKITIAVAVLLIAFSLLYHFVIIHIFDKKNLEQCLAEAKEIYKEKWGIRCREHNRPVGEDGLCETLPDYAGEEINKIYKERIDMCFRKYSAK